MNQHKKLSLAAEQAFWSTKNQETPVKTSNLHNVNLGAGLSKSQMESFTSVADLNPLDKRPISDEGAVQLNYNDYVADTAMMPENTYSSAFDFDLPAGFYATKKFTTNTLTETDYDSNLAEFVGIPNIKDLIRQICDLYRREGIQIDVRILNRKIPDNMLKFARSVKSQNLWMPSDNQQLLRDYLNDLYISTIVIPGDPRLTDDAMVQRRQRVVTKDSEAPSEVKTFKNMIASDIQNIDVWAPVRSYIKQDFRGNQIHERPQREFFKHVRYGIADAHGTLWQDDVGGSKETPLRKWDMTAFKQGPYAERFNNNYHYNFDQDLFK